MSKRVNCAEAMDRMQKGVSWGMIVCGVTYFFVAAEKLFEDNPVNDYLDFASGVGVFLTCAITLLAMFPVIRMKLKGEMTGKEPESFFSQAMITSVANSFHINLFVIIVMLGLTSKIDEWSMPPSFYLVLIFGSLVFWVGANFLFLTRNDGLEEDNFDEDGLYE